MLALQSEKGQHDHCRGRHVAITNAVSAERASPASEWPAIPAQLPARQLARLSLLGYRTGAVAAAHGCDDTGGRYDSQRERDHHVPAGERKAKETPGRFVAAHDLRRLHAAQQVAGRAAAEAGSGPG